MRCFSSGKNFRVALYTRGKPYCIRQNVLSDRVGEISQRSLGGYKVMFVYLPGKL